MQITALKNKHKTEYFKLLAELINGIEVDKKIDNIIESLLQEIVTFVESLNDFDRLNFQSNPEFYLESTLNVTFLKAELKFNQVFKKYLIDCWSKCLDLGVQHQIDELLWTIQPLQKYLVPSKKLNISSFSTDNLASLLFSKQKEEEEEQEEEMNIASFNAMSDRNIARAKKNEATLKANIAILKAQGVYRDLRDDFKLAARYSINERLTFLNSLNYIGNYTRRAEAANKYYLGQNYFTRRVSVLDTRYSQTQNNEVRRYVADYLKNDSVSMTELLTKNQRMSTLIGKIENKVAKAKDGRKIKESAKVKAKAILRTELSIGYNLGKLSGFMSPEDWDTQFKWNAAFELENRRDDYEVCIYCEKMDGTVMTAREIIEEGVRLDTSVGNYNPRINQTKWKDLNNPQIPFHVNCSCFWEIVPPDKDDLEEAAIQASLPRLRKKKIQQEVVDENILNPQTIIGAGLLLAGTGILLSRSNAAREFIKAIPEMPIKTDDVVDNVVTTYKAASEAAKDAIQKSLAVALR